MEQASRAAAAHRETVQALLLAGSLPLLVAFAGVVVYAPWYLSTAAMVAVVLGALILLRPRWGLYLVVLLVPVNAFSVGLILKEPWNYQMMRSYADKIPLLVPLLPLTLAGALFLKLARLERVSLRDPMITPSLLLLGYAAISLSWTDNLGHGTFQFLRLVVDIVVYVLVVALVREEQEYRGLVWCWLVSMTVQSLIAIGLFTYESIDYVRPLLPRVLFQFKVFGGMLLATGAPNVAAGLQDFHETSLLTNMAAALTFGLLLSQQRRGKRFAVLALLFVLFLFITMRTESRAGIGSMLVMLVALALLMPQLKFRRIRTAAIFILCAGSIYAVTRIYLYTMTEVTQTPRMVYVVEEILGGGNVIDTGHKEKESGRIYMYTQSFRTLFANNPLIGLGAGNLKYLVKLPHAHSLYFSLVLDFGLAGLLFVAVVTKVLLQRLHAILRLPESFSKTMALAATAGLAGAAVHCLVDFDYNYISLWLFLGIVMSAYTMALSRGQQLPESARSVQL